MDNMTMEFDAPTTDAPARDQPTTDLPASRELVAAREPALPALPTTATDRLMDALGSLILNIDAPIERAHQAFDFIQRMKAADAKIAYDDALAAAQAEFPTITKNRQVGFDAKSGGSRTEYKHEDLAELVSKCVPVLARHGISVKWRTANPLNERIRVTCVLTHRLGHAEENSLEGASDNTGNKNPLQAVASTITFLERYTFKSAIGQASAHDDDGRAGGGTGAPSNPDAPLIGDEQLIYIREAIEAMGTDVTSETAGFAKYMGIGRMADMPMSEFERAKIALKNRAEHVKKQQTSKVGGR